MTPTPKPRVTEKGHIALSDELTVKYRDPKVHAKRAQRYTWKGKAYGMVEYVVVTGVLFGMFVLVLNFPAYFAQMKYLWGEWRGDNKHTQEALEELASLRGSAPLETRTVIEGQRRDIPPLHLKVTPPDNRIIIPRIGQNIPIQDIPVDHLVNEKWEALEQEIQKALETGVIRYPGTARPGEKGNVFITGHSSYYLWAPGAYKDVFALLPNVEVGDTVTVYYNQRQFVYEIQEKKTVKPTEVDVLRQGEDKRLTLMTCVPVGTNLNRLILVAKEKQS